MILHALASEYGGTPWDYLHMTGPELTVCVAALKVGMREKSKAQKEAERKAGKVGNQTRGRRRF